MRLLLLSLPLFFLSPSELPADDVYICKGPGSKRYHLDKECRGLSNCSTDTYKVTKEEAINTYKRTLCKWED